MDLNPSEGTSTHTQQPSGYDSAQAPTDDVTDPNRVAGSPEEDTQLDRSFASEHLDELILAILFCQGEANGMEVIRECTRCFGVQFSPGTVYPHLHSLEEDGILAQRETVQTKEYRIVDEQAAADALTATTTQLTRLSGFFATTLRQTETPE